MAFPPPLGGGSPIAGILGGLGGLMQGFLQGREAKDQEALQRQQIAGAQQDVQTSKLTNAMNVFGLLSKLGQSDPQALNSPAMQAFINQNVGQGGIPIPRDAQGNVDVNAFRTPLSAFSTTPEYEKFLSLPQGSPARVPMLSSYGGSDADKQALLNLPQQHTQSEIDNAATNYRYYMQLIQNGADPKSLLPAINAEALVAGAPQLQINAQGQVVPIGGQAGLGASTKTQAQVHSLNSGADLNDARAQLVKLQAKYFPMLKVAELGKLQAQTNLTNLQVQYLPQRVAIAWKDANARQESADAAYGRFQDDHATFTKLGSTPAGVAAYTGMVNSLQTSTTQDRLGINDIQNSLRKIETNNGGKAPIDTHGQNPKEDATYQVYAALQTQLAHVNARYNQGVITLKQLRGGQANLIRQVRQSHGAPASWQPVPATDTHPGGGSGPPKGAFFSPDHKQYWYQGKTYDAATGKLVH